MHVGQSVAFLILVKSIDRDRQNSHEPRQRIANNQCPGDPRHGTHAKGERCHFSGPQMVAEPGSRLAGNLFQRASLFKQVRGTGHDAELFGTGQQGIGNLVKFKNFCVKPTHHQQGGGAHPHQIMAPGQVRAATA